MTTLKLHLSAVGYTILAACFLFLAGVGRMIRPRVKCAADFFHSARL